MKYDENLHYILAGDKSFSEMKMKIEMNEVEDGDGNEDIVENEETPAASGSGTGLTLQDRTLSSQGSLDTHMSSGLGQRSVQLDTLESNLDFKALFSHVKQNRHQDVQAQEHGHT